MEVNPEVQEFFSQLVNKIILWSGGIGVIVIAVTAYITRLFAQKTQLNWKKSADKEIENIKGDINSNNSIIATLLGQHGQTNQKVLDKQIEFVQIAWKYVLKLKATVPSIVATSYNIFSDDELENGILDEDRGHGVLGDLVGDIIMSDEITKLSAISDDVRELRPFLSHKLSLQLFAYGALLGRLVYILSDSYQKGSVKVWRKDSGVKQILEVVLNQKEITYVYSIKLQSFNIMIDLLETKILNEMSFMLSGQKSAEDALSQVEKWTSIVGKRPE